MTVTTGTARGFCHCGCGQRTSIATKNVSTRGLVKGEPVRFVVGHAASLARRNGKPWNGLSVRKGYALQKKPDHPRAGSNGYVSEHLLIVEAVLGKFLPPNAEIHHVNGIRNDNRTCNLVVCENGAYHQTLHRRQRALDSCGNANWLKCPYCKRYDDPGNLRGKLHAHLRCFSDAMKNRRSTMPLIQVGP